MLCDSSHDAADPQLRDGLLLHIFPSIVGDVVARTAVLNH